MCRPDRAGAYHYLTGAIRDLPDPGPHAMTSFRIVPKGTPGAVPLKEALRICGIYIDPKPPRRRKR